MISKCEADNHYLKITPDPANTIVTFNGAAKSDNTYKFDVANHYRVEVVVAAETPRTYIFNVLKRFNKDIFYFRWSTNDVVSVINNPANNGGYSFAGYSWYLNDAANPETRSYLEVKSGDKVEVILTGEYNSEATGTIPISGVPTCPCMVGSSTQANIQAYPSILNTGEKVTIATENMSDVDLKGAEAGIISPLGSRITSIPLTGSKTEVKMPDAPGIYLLKVSTNSITREFKVILK